MLDIHDDDPEFGYRFIADRLERNGTPSKNRVQRLYSAGASDLSTTANEGALNREAGRRFTTTSWTATSLRNGRISVGCATSPNKPWADPTAESASGTTMSRPVLFESRSSTLSRGFRDIT